MTNLIPLLDNVLVEVLEKEKETKSWFALPNWDNEQIGIWKVVAIWPWKMLDSWVISHVDIEEWDIIHFIKYQGNNEIKDWDNKYLVINHNALLAKVKK